MALQFPYSVAPHHSTTLTFEQHMKNIESAYRNLMSAAMIVSSVDKNTPLHDFIGALVREWCAIGKERNMTHFRDRIQALCYILQYKKFMNVNEKDNTVVYHYEYGSNQYIISPSVYYACGYLRKPSRNLLKFSEDPKNDASPGNEVTITENTPRFIDSTNTERIRAVVALFRNIAIYYLRLVVSILWHYPTPPKQVFRLNPAFDKEWTRKAIMELIAKLEKI